MDMRWAMILAAGLVLAALAHGGVYEITTPAGGQVDFVGIYRVNKFTGSVLFCAARACYVAERE
jgi:hypothetical protein